MILKMKIKSQTNTRDLRAFPFSSTTCLNHENIIEKTIHNNYTAVIEHKVIFR